MEIELNDLNRDHEIDKHREEEDGDEETDLGGTQGSDLLDNLDWLSRKGKEVVDINHLDPYKKEFGDRYYEARNIGYFIEDVLLMEKECTNPRFIKYLIDTQDMTMKKTVSVAINDYEVEYYGEPFRNDNSVRERPYRSLRTKNGVIADPNQRMQLIDDIRFHYDTWKKLELNKVMKKAGIATAIGLSLTALITGLALGLKRTGSDIIRGAVEQKKEMGAEKLTPAKREIIPWTEIEEASGKGLIFIGNHIYLVIGGSLLYLYTRRKHK